MAELNEPTTSTSLAKAMRTNPVVVRRIMAGLRKEGLVVSKKGHGGGWQLSCDIKKVTLYDIYKALNFPPLLAFGNRTTSPLCLLEKTVHNVMSVAFAEVENRLIKKFRTTTIFDVQSARKKIEKNNKSGTI